MRMPLIKVNMKGKGRLKKAVNETTRWLEVWMEA